MNAQIKMTMAEMVDDEAFEVAQRIGTDKLRSIAIQDLKSEPLLELLTFWNKARDGMPIPCAACIEPSALSRHLSQIILIEVSHEPVDFAYRILGSDVTNALRVGQSAARKSVREIEHSGLPLGRFLYSAYSWILQQAKPVAMSGPNKMLGDGFTSQEMIYLPFSDGSSKITRILGASVYYR